MNKTPFQVCGFLLSIYISGCAFAPPPISDAVPSNGTTCFVGESSGPFTEFTSCNPEIIRKETKSNNGADLIYFQAFPPFKTSAGSELSIVRIVSPTQLSKGEKDSVRKYHAVFDVGQDEYSHSLHIDDVKCTFSFRIGKKGNVRVWRLTHIYNRTGYGGLSPEINCALEQKKWEEVRAFQRISTEKTEK